MLVRMWKSRNSHSLLGMQNGTTTLEDSLVMSYETENTLGIKSSSHTPWYLFKGVEHLGSHKILNTDVFIS